MTDDEIAALAALEELLDLTDPSDWHMLHATVRGDVAEGKFSRDFEAAYKVKLRAAIAALGIPVSATIEQAEPPQDCSPVAWITSSGLQCLGRGDGPVRCIAAMDEDCDFTVPLYDSATLADVSRVARALAMERAELRNEALRVLVAWDGTVLPRGRDDLLQERIESLRALLGASA